MQKKKEGGTTATKNAAVESDARIPTATNPKDGTIGMMVREWKTYQIVSAAAKIVVEQAKNI